MKRVKLIKESEEVKTHPNQESDDGESSYLKLARFLIGDIPAKKKKEKDNGKD